MMGAGTGEAGFAPLPNFVVIGAPRSGTTLLWRYLRQHPDVFMAPEKELRFFVDASGNEDVERYRRHFDGWRGERAVGEASPVYMYSREALERMAQVLPDARLIAVLRDPVDRAYSDYWQRCAEGREHRSFAQVVAAGGAIYLLRSRYRKHLEQVCQVYPREALDVELFEELCGTPLEVYRAVCRHVGVSTDFVPADLGESANSFVRFRSLRVRALARRLPGVASKALGRLNASKEPYPPMDPGLRRELGEEFRGENARLAAWLGRELTAWDDDGRSLTRRA